MDALKFPLDKNIVKQIKVVLAKIHRKQTLQNRYSVLKTLK